MKIFRGTADSELLRTVRESSTSLEEMKARLEAKGIDASTVDELKSTFPEADKTEQQNVLGRGGSTLEVFERQFPPAMQKVAGALFDIDEVASSPEFQGPDNTSEAPLTPEAVMELMRETIGDNDKARLAQLILDPNGFEKLSTLEPMEVLDSKIVEQHELVGIALANLFKVAA